MSLNFILEFALVRGQQLDKWGIQLCIKNFFFYVHSSHFPYFLSFFYPLHHLSGHAPALGVLLAFAFISVAQEKIDKQGQLGRERNADNILRDLKEIFTPSWELASPAEGNAVQLERAGCLILVNFFLAGLCKIQTRVVPVLTCAVEYEDDKKRQVERLEVNLDL